MELSERKTKKFQIVTKHKTNIYSLMLLVPIELLLKLYVKCIESTMSIRNGTILYSRNGFSATKVHVNRDKYSPMIDELKMCLFNLDTFSLSFYYVK